jgi:hypothetical protein
MVELDGAVRNMEGLQDFHEATWVFKRNGTYYLTYADNNSNHNRLNYATSTNPLGPWQYKGVYLDETDCDTSHGSVVEYKGLWLMLYFEAICLGHWYAFYHNCVISHQGNLRCICVDKLYFNTDGSIQLVKQTTNWTVDKD